MCKHYRQAILKGETIPDWSIDQFSEIKVLLGFHYLMQDVYPRCARVLKKSGLQGRCDQPAIEAARFAV